jgi:hypothetical protein
MAIDKYEDLPGIVSEIQDGGLQVFDVNNAPTCLVLGTSAQGVSDVPVAVVRSQEFENRFGKEGTLMSGVYETLSGGAGNVYGMRIGARSAILFGVGTDDMVSNPTSIETLIKDRDAGDVYSLRYVTPASRGPNEVVGHLKVKNAVGQVVYDSNPGGQLIDTGEVLVSGDYVAGVDIGLSNDPLDYVVFSEISRDRVAQEDIFAAVVTAPATFSLSQTPNAGTLVVSLDGDEVAEADYTVVGQDLTFNVTTDADNKEVTASFEYDAEGSLNLREGSDGTDLSKMELYEALEEAYRRLETEEYKFVIPRGISIDAANIADGATVVLSSDERVEVGSRYPVADANGDALGRLFVEEYDGEFFYFWDINNDGAANVWPKIGLASATTKIDGSALGSDDFNEVNFAYQLANFCFVSSSNEYNVLGAIGSNMPKSFAPKDISKWVGKDAVYDVDGDIVQDGSGLLGNKIMVGKLSNRPGLFATDAGQYQGSGGSLGGGVEKDRGGKPIDIGKYLSVYVAPQTFFNSTDETGFGYNANGAAYYLGYVSTLVVQSAPTNKIAEGATSPIKLSKAKLNSLAKYGFVALKHKNRVLRFSDAPTAARKESDFVRLTTVRVVQEIIDDVRRIAAPYIGESNTKVARQSLETNLKKLLGTKQELNVIQGGTAIVTASVKQRIEGDMTVELVIIPPYEVRKITVVTSLAKE